MLSSFLLASFLGLAFCQSTCGPPPTITSTFSPITMRYTPFMTTQVAPTSTVWDTIVTTWFNALDCRYVTPLRVDENPAVDGPFTTFVHSPILTVTRVGCMPETVAVTRREIRGENQIELRSAGVEQGHKMPKRNNALAAIEEVIEKALDDFPPETSTLTVQAYRYLVSVNTAIFAINLFQAGIDLNQTCKLLREPASQAKFFRTTIDPIQAGDIVCFAANNGLYFAVGLDKVITYLQSLIYALQVRSKFPANSTEFCWPLLTKDSPFLGIDTNGIANYLCPGSVETVTPTVSSKPIPTNSIGPGSEVSNTNAGTATNTITSANTSTGTIASTGTGVIVGPPTGGPFANTSAITVTWTGSHNSSSAEPTTSWSSPPYANATTTASDAGSTTTNIGTIGTISTFNTISSSLNSSNTTTPIVGTGTATESGVVPPSSTIVSPEIESVTSTPSHRHRRW